jgi:hypothetical protein
MALKIVAPKARSMPDFPQPIISALMNIYRYHKTLIPKSGDECVWDKTI